LYLESQMLEEMGRAVCCVGFRATSGIDPDADSRSLGPR